MELDALQQVYPQILEQGGELIIMSPQLPENSQKMAQDQNYTFPLAFDHDNKLASDLGIAHVLPKDLSELYLQFGINIPQSNGTESWQVPMPARYLIDQNGLIRDTAINPDYTNRPEPSDLLPLLKELA